MGSDIQLFGAVASTNSVMRDLAAKGAPEGTVVIADEQTAGHGRFGKPWFSPPRVNLYASVLFRPVIPPSEAPGFSFVGPLAVADTIKAEGLDATIKWPNDILVEGKKVAGILVECATIDHRVDYVTIGFGVNLNVTRQELSKALGASGRAAGSLAEFAGHEIDRNAFAAALLNHLAAWVADVPGARRRVAAGRVARSRHLDRTARRGSWRRAVLRGTGARRRCPGLSADS